MNNVIRYKAVVFDMGDIFFDATPWRRWLTEELKSRGVDIDYPALCVLWEARLVDVYLGRAKYWSRFAEFLGELGVTGCVADEVIKAARQKGFEVEKRTLFDGVAVTLETLNGMGVKLAVLSDTESPEARVRSRLAALGIEQYFDAVLTSVDIGHVKPQKEAFMAAMARLGTMSCETLFVGHDEDELQGAKACGLGSVAYNSVDGVKADCRIAHFSELIGLVRYGLSRNSD